MSPVAKIRALDSDIARLIQTRHEMIQDTQARCTHARVNVIQASRLDSRLFRSSSSPFLPSFRVCTKCGFAETESSEATSRYDVLTDYSRGGVSRVEAEKHVIGGLHFAE